MRATVLALVVWSMVAAFLIVGGPSIRGGMPESPAEEQSLAGAAHAFLRGAMTWILWMWPILLVVGAGYGSILLIALSRRRPKTRGNLPMTGEPTDG